MFWLSRYKINLLLLLLPSLSVSLLLSLQLIMNTIVVSITIMHRPLLLFHLYICATATAIRVGLVVSTAANELVDSSSSYFDIRLAAAIFFKLFWCSSFVATTLPKKMMMTLHELNIRATNTIIRFLFLYFFSSFFDPVVMVTTLHVVGLF